MSLFTSDLFFEDKASNSGYDQFENDITAQINDIEDNILNMIDDEPQDYLSNSKSFEGNSQQDFNSNFMKPSGLSLGCAAFKPQSFQRKSSATNSTNSSDNCDASSSPDQVDTKRISKLKQYKKNKKQFSFPEGGWECSTCQNYNFKGREECFRCKKSKNDSDTEGKPKHMYVDIDTKESIRKDRRVLGKQQKKERKQVSLANPVGGDLGAGQFRPGDWTCYQCQNFNYSFREQCNKCNMTQFQSNYSRGLIIQQNQQMYNPQFMQAQLAQQMPFQMQQTMCQFGQIPQQMPQMQQMNNMMTTQAFQQQQPFVQW